MLNEGGQAGKVGGGITGADATNLGKAYESPGPRFPGWLFVQWPSPEAATASALGHEAVATAGRARRERHRGPTPDSGAPPTD